MDRIDDFIEFVESICRRSRMYTMGGSFNEVWAYIAGYAQGSPDSPLSGEGWHAFNEFVCLAHRFPTKYVWCYVLKHCSRDDEEAIGRLQSLVTEFARRTRTESHDEILQEMQARALSQDEGEPEKTWRQFSRVMFRGRREEIEPLIQEHPDADILWAGAYPDDVATLLEKVADSYPVSRVSGSEEGGEVTVITPDFGPVPLKFMDGTWRIDATKIIEAWKANRQRKVPPERATDG